jgi:hypothetical protein
MKYAYIQHEDQEEFLEIVLQADGLQETNWQNMSLYGTLPIRESCINRQILNRVWNFSRIEVMNQCTTASNSQPGWIPAEAQQHNKFINQIQTMQNTTLTQHTKTLS